MTGDELQKGRTLMSEGSSEQYHPKAFVSHSTQDHEFVVKFATDLRANGVDAWYSGWEIKPGDSIRAKIEEGLEGCEYFVIALSKNSINRPWVQKELDAATVRNIGGKVRKIVPVKIEECGDLPPTLASLCWEDFSNQPYEAALKRVLDSIFGVDVRPPLGNPPKTTTLDELTLPEVQKTPNKRNCRLALSAIGSSVQVRPGSETTATLMTINNSEGRFENTCEHVRVELYFLHTHSGQRVHAPGLFVATNGEPITAKPSASVSLRMLESRQFAIFVCSEGANWGFYTFTNWPFAVKNEKKLLPGEWSLQIRAIIDGDEDAAADYIVQLNTDLSAGWTPSGQT